MHVRRGFINSWAKNNARLRVLQNTRNHLFPPKWETTWMPVAARGLRCGVSSWPTIRQEIGLVSFSVLTAACTRCCALLGAPRLCTLNSHPPSPICFYFALGLYAGVSLRSSTSRRTVLHWIPTGFTLGCRTLRVHDCFVLGTGSAPLGLPLRGPVLPLLQWPIKLPASAVQITLRRLFISR